MSGQTIVMNSTLATGPNVITVEMDQYPFLNDCGGCNARALTAPQWVYAAPTPDMEAKGLKASKLREILQKINDDADKTMARDYCCNGWPSRFRNVPWILPLIGFALYSMGSTAELIGVALLMIGPCIGVCVVWWVLSRWRHEWQICVDEMKQYVQETLNEEWQNSNGIRWTVETCQILQTRGNGRRQSRTLTLYHIQITDLTPPAQQVPMQQMVQIPVNAQGQQIVMVNGQQMVVVPLGTQIPMMQQTQVQHVVAESQDAGGAVTATEGGNAVYN